MKHMVELVIIRGKDGNGEMLKMKTDDGQIAFEHCISREDKLKWLFTVTLNYLPLFYLKLKLIYNVFAIPR